MKSEEAGGRICNAAPNVPVEAPVRSAAGRAKEDALFGKAGRAGAGQRDRRGGALPQYSERTKHCSDGIWQDNVGVAWRGV